MNIVISTPSFFPVHGGAEVGIHELAERMALTDSVTVLARRPAQNEVSGAANHSVSRSYSLRYFRPFEYRLRPTLLRKVVASTGISYLLALRKLSRTQEIDVVNFHFLKPHGLVSAYVRWILNAGVVFSLVGRTDVFADLGVSAKFHARLSLVSAQAITQNSEYYLNGLDVKRPVYTIPYGVDLHRFAGRNLGSHAHTRRDAGIPQDAHVLLAVQRLTAVKNVDRLLAAFDEVAEQESSAHLVIAGWGPEGDRLRAAADRSRHATRIHFHGYVTDNELPSLYSMADLFVSYSSSETFGVTFAEAMSSGLPIVALARSCVPMVVRPANGRLVDSLSPHEFATAVLDLIRDGSVRAEMSAVNTRRAVEEFDWDRIAAAHLKVLRQAAWVAGQRQRP